MKIIKKFITLFTLWLFWTPIFFGNLALVQAQSPYDQILSSTTTDKSLSSAINGNGDVIKENTKWWADLFNEQILKIISYIIDIFIVLWIAVAFFGGYKIMTSDKEDSMKEWIRLIIFGIIWIIIRVSAKFLASALVWNDEIITHEFANPSSNYSPNWIQFADNLYQKILFPFIKLILYFVVWILFFMMAGKVIWFVTATDDSAKKKAWWIIIRCVIWILIVMWSKQIVEAVMWNQDEVLKKKIITTDGTIIQNAPIRIDEQWKQILEFGSIPIIAQIINRIMWLTTFAIVILIIIQWYRIFTNPGDAKTMEWLKKAILYIFIWILVIWAAYVISNMLVINNVSITTSKKTIKKFKHRKNSQSLLRVFYTKSIISTFHKHL